MDCTEKFIGNVVTRERLAYTDFMCVTDDIKTVVPGIPTLIVGWSLVKELMGANRPLVLDKEIDRETWWTFGRMERRSEMEPDYAAFYKECLSRVSRSLEYRFFNVLTCSFGEARDFVRRMRSESSIRWCYVLDNSFVYVMDERRRCVTGFSLDALSFMGVHKRKTLKKMLDVKANRMFRDVSFLPYHVRRMVGDDNVVVPWLYAAKKS